MSYDYQPPKRPLTGNGKSWGENAGHVGQGLMYGYALKKAIEAEQRRPEVAGESPWTPAQTVGVVFVLWVAYIVVWIMDLWLMLTGVAMLPIMLDKGVAPVTAVICWTLLGIPAIIAIRLCQIGMREGLRYHEGLTTDRPKRKFIPKGMLALAILPQFYLLPLTIVALYLEKH